MRGTLPKKLAGKSKITQRRWKKYENHISQENPITKGLRYLRVFENESVNTYARAAEILEVSRQRVYQHVALVTKLAPVIIDFLMENRNNLDISSYFTERRLRPLIKMVDRQEQVRAFREMLTRLEAESPANKAFSALFDP